MSTVDCEAHPLGEKDLEIPTRQNKSSSSTRESRCEVMIENYCKTIIIEAKTMRSMSVKRIAPAVERYTAELASNMAAKKAVLPDLECRFEAGTIAGLSELTDSIYGRVAVIESILAQLESGDYMADAVIIRDQLLPEMEKLRAYSDAAEKNTSKSFWPLPNYGLLLFGEK